MVYNIGYKGEREQIGAIMRLCIMWNNILPYPAVGTSNLRRGAYWR